VEEAMLNDLLSGHKNPSGDYTELRAQVNTTRQVTLLKGNMVSNAQSARGGVSARVYKGGVYGFASAAEYSEESVKNVLKAASGNAAFMNDHVKKNLPKLPPGKPGKFGLKKTQGKEIPQSVLIEYIKELDSMITAKYKNLTSRTVIAGCLDIEKLLAVSSGADSHSFQPRSNVYVFFNVETDDGVPVELYERFGGFGSFDEQFTNPAIQFEALEPLHAALMKKREGVYADAGLHKCVLHPELAGMLVHEAVGHTVEADTVLGGSVAAYNLGNQVAGELITMIDFAHTALGKPCPLPVYVDDEGTIAEDAVLIENGILKGYMHSKESARELSELPGNEDMKPQGNARAFAFSDEPLIRMRNTAILPGKSKLDEMIAGIDNG